MKNLTKKTVIALFVIIIVVSLMLPKSVFGGLFELVSEGDAQALLGKVRTPISEEWKDFAIQDEELVALALLDNALAYESFSFWSFQVIESILVGALKSGKLFLPSSLKEIENKIGNIQKSVEIGKFLAEFLTQRGIKLIAGELSYSYSSCRDGIEEVTFYYILTYHSLNNDYGEIEATFYSPNAISPPKQLAFPLIGGRFLLEDCKELRPFVVQIEGQVKKVALGYEWQQTRKMEVTWEESMPFFTEILIEAEKETSRSSTRLQKIQKVATETADAVIDWLINGVKKVANFFSNALSQLNPFKSKESSKTEAPEETPTATEEENYKTVAIKPIECSYYDYEGEKCKATIKYSEHIWELKDPYSLEKEGAYSSGSLIHKDKKCEAVLCLPPWAPQCLGPDDYVQKEETEVRLGGKEFFRGIQKGVCNGHNFKDAFYILEVDNEDFSYTFDVLGGEDRCFDNFEEVLKDFEEVLKTFEFIEEKSSN